MAVAVIVTVTVTVKVVGGSVPVIPILLSLVSRWQRRPFNTVPAGTQRPFDSIALVMRVHLIPVSLFRSASSHASLGHLPVPSPRAVPC